MVTAGNNRCATIVILRHAVVILPVILIVVAANKKQVLHGDSCFKHTSLPHSSGLLPHQQHHIRSIVDFASLPSTPIPFIIRV
ncbi:hypothetical protein BDZ85DRAFT_1564 [Elsinoe ampelina]|uniref:Uncharacterized protein n=1 Tax=Elsinoe ampelina TaxID=302913 RepID=A0A6A6GP80_9PEZI|nr:hypothetical protein BDZ85DRAFT_1564 [Elsinoe ampelina]